MSFSSTKNSATAQQLELGRQVEPNSLNTVFNSDLGLTRSAGLSL